MAALINGPFDANQFNPATGGGGQLGVGFHKVIIEASEVKPTAANDGGMIAFTLRAIEGEEQGGSQAYRLNLYNNSDKAKEIAQSQFSALCFVTGVFYVEDTQQLHNVPFYVEVVKQKNDEKYHEVRAVFDVNGCAPKSNKPEPRLVAFFQGGGAKQTQQTNTQQAQGNQQQQQQQTNTGNTGGGWGGGSAANNAVKEEPAPQQQQTTSGGWQGNNGGGQQQQQQQQTQQTGNGGGWSQGGNANGGNGGAQTQPSWGRPS